MSKGHPELDILDEASDFDQLKITVKLVKHLYIAVFGDGNGDKGMKRTMEDLNPAMKVLSDAVSKLSERRSEGTFWKRWFFAVSTQATSAVFGTMMIAIGGYLFATLVLGFEVRLSQVGAP